MSTCIEPAIRHYRIQEEHYMYLYRISYMYYIVIGFVTTVLVTLVASLFFESNVNKLDPKLFFPTVSKRLERRVKATSKKHSTTSKTVTFSLDS